MAGAPFLFLPSVFSNLLEPFLTAQRQQRTQLQTDLNNLRKTFYNISI